MASEVEVETGQVANEDRRQGVRRYGWRRLGTRLANGLGIHIFSSLTRRTRTVPIRQMRASLLYNPVTIWRKQAAPLVQILAMWKMFPRTPEQATTGRTRAMPQPSCGRSRIWLPCQMT